MGQDRTSARTRYRVGGETEGSDRAKPSSLSSFACRAVVRSGARGSRARKRSAGTSVRVAPAFRAPQLDVLGWMNRVVFGVLDLVQEVTRVASRCRDWDDGPRSNLSRALAPMTLVLQLLLRTPEIDRQPTR